MERPGAFAALSDDDGATWTERELPQIVTVGYVTAAQGPDGVIHIVTSHNKPRDVNIDLNEAWVRTGGPEAPADSVRTVKKYREEYANTNTRATWSAGISAGNRYLLDGVETFYCYAGEIEWRATYQAGRKIGTETYWDCGEPDRKKWEREYAPDGTWTWRIYDGASRVAAQSRWKGKDLLEVPR